MGSPPRVVIIQAREPQSTNVRSAKSPNGVNLPQPLLLLSAIERFTTPAI
jgi:hypothetical protein